MGFQQGPSDTAEGIQNLTAQSIVILALLWGGLLYVQNPIHPIYPDPTAFSLRSLRSLRLIPLHHRFNATRKIRSSAVR